MSLVNSKILILGCGYVGLRLAEHLQRLGQEIIATTTTPSKLVTLEQVASCAVLVRGTDDFLLAHVLQNVTILVVMVGARGADYESTYLQTANTIAKVLQGNTHLQQVIYTSSYAVYGDQLGAWVEEETPVRPANTNGEILVQTEQVLLGAATLERSICIFRLGGIYGPGRDFGRIFGPIAGKVRPGSDKEPGNWIHVEDVVGAITFAIQHRLNGIYNLVSQPIESGELLAAVCREYQLAPIQFDPSLPSQRPYNARVSNQKLQNAGYQFRHPQVWLDLEPT
jgi:nucleoside-diphosphate-sugar epimerase